MILSEEATRFWSITKKLRCGQVVSSETKEELIDLIKAARHNPIRRRINQLAGPRTDPTPGFVIDLQKDKVRRQSR